MGAPPSAVSLSPCPALCSPEDRGSGPHSGPEGAGLLKLLLSKSSSCHQFANKMVTMPGNPRGSKAARGKQNQITPEGSSSWKQPGSETQSREAEPGPRTTCPLPAPRAPSPHHRAPSPLSLEAWSRDCKLQAEGEASSQKASCGPYFGLFNFKIWVPTSKIMLSCKNPAPLFSPSRCCG